jgi:monofunctional biosynthetic peptidoglycan transglycosylase
LKLNLRRTLLTLVAALVACAGYVLSGLPPRREVRALVRHNPGKTAVMRQREAEARKAGRRLATRQTYVPLARVSRNLIGAVVVAEDGRFFGHDGVDWEALKESVETNVRRGRFARGGSTITLQLAKNLFFTTRKSVTRKLREFLVARWLEEDLSKRRILELYLNVIEWGDGVYGCEAAAQRYYGKPASALGPEEAAGLAAMIPNPRRLNPLASPARHARRQKRVLWLMARAGYVKREVSNLGTEPPADPVEAEEDEGGADPSAEPSPGDADDIPLPPGTPASP